MKKLIFFMIILFLSVPARSEGVPSIPSGMETTKLADIFNNPVAYDGKKVLLVGTVANICPTSGCHFIFQESGETIRIYPKGFKLPKLKKGKPISIYAEVRAGEKRVVITALGLEVK